MAKTKSKKHPQGKEKDLFTTKKQYTVMDAKKKLQNKDAEIEEKLRKLEQIREASRVDLDEKFARQMVERAITKRPIKMKRKGKKKDQSTAFTEEDFKKFEEEYHG